MRQTAAELGGRARNRDIPGGRLRIALYEPDIPQNTGALFRLAACLGVEVDLIEPCGFLFDDRRLKRRFLDYAATLRVRRHVSWAAFLADRDPRSRIILMTTSGPVGTPPFRVCRRRHDLARPRERRRARARP